MTEEKRIKRLLLRLARFERARRDAESRGLLIDLLEIEEVMRKTADELAELGVESPQWEP